MEREELLEKVTSELGDIQLTLSERTVNEELDDALEDFGEDEEQNAKLVSKVASRLKRMDGNLHADVSKQVDAYKADYRKKQRDKQKPQPKEESADDLKQLRDEVAALRAESEARRKSEAKNATLKDVRNGLEEKFSKAGIEVNRYFMKNALQKLNIPDEGADREKLVAEAERIYNGDMKEAGVESHQMPHYGNKGGKGTTAASDFFARKAKKEGWGNK